MCTVVVSVDPPAAVPVLLVMVRDEVRQRPWEPPARHWPEHPDVVGGRDVGGGTWLAVDPWTRRAAALLDAEELPARDPRRLSRGRLPLLAVSTGVLPELELARYQPFGLLLADLDGARLWHWDGRCLTEEALGPGTHLLVNNGWENHTDPRIAQFTPRFAALTRPAELTAAEPREFWGGWLHEATGADLPFADPRNIVVWEVGSDGRIWVSMSTSMIAMSDAGVRYDFTAEPGNPDSFHPILPPGYPSGPWNTTLATTPAPAPSSRKNQPVTTGCRNHTRP